MARLHGIIVQLAVEYLPQPFAGIVHSTVHPPYQLPLHALQKAGHPFCDRFTAQAETFVSGSSAVMRETQKIERRWPAFSPPLAVAFGKATEFYQPCFVGVQTESEFLQPSLQFPPKAVGLSLVLEAYHEIVRVAKKVHLTLLHHCDLRHCRTHKSNT